MQNKWVVVVDDSNCTVGVGGEGYLWEVEQSEGNYYNAVKGFYNYNKSIFRDATEEEINNWLKDKTRANVPKNNKPKLYCNILGNINNTLNSLLENKQ